MGCDIHTIVEVKKDNKWTRVPECPEVFQNRNYSIFAILNENVRNYNGTDGFSGKGLPKDISGMQFDFESERKFLLCKWKVFLPYK